MCASSSCAPHTLSGKTNLGTISLAWLVPELVNVFASQQWVLQVATEDAQ